MRQAKLGKLNGRSLSSLIMKADNTQRLENAIKIKRSLESEVNKEIGEINKSLYNTTTQRTINLSNLSHNKLIIKEDKEPKTETLEDIIKTFNIRKDRGKTIKRAFSVSRFLQVKKLKVSLPLGNVRHRKQSSDLRELQKRVDLTEKNLYIHMNSIDTMIICMDDCISGRKLNNTMRRLERLRRRIRDVKSMRKQIEEECKVNKNRISVSLMKIKRCVATRKDILKSLINITGEMANVSDNISKQNNFRKL